MAQEPGKLAQELRHMDFYNCSFDTFPAGRNTDLFTPDFFGLNPPASVNGSFPQRIFDIVKPLPVDRPFPISFQQSALAVPHTQRLRQSSLPSLQAGFGVSSIRPQSNPIPDDNLRSQNPHYEETGMGSWFCDCTPASVTVPPIHLPTTSFPPLVNFPADWVEIPQRTYNRGPKRLGFEQLGPIHFSTMSRPGINLGDALRKNFVDLVGRDDPMLQGSSGVISCRLLFPGYPENGSSCQIHTLNWTRTRTPIPRSKLAYEIARKVERYLTQMTRVVPDGSVEDRWRIGQGFMHIDNIFLVSLVSVSRGSFQPEIWVAVPPAPHARTDKGRN